MGIELTIYRLRQHRRLFTWLHTHTHIYIYISLSSFKFTSFSCLNPISTYICMNIFHIHVKYVLIIHHMPYIYSIRHSIAYHNLAYVMSYIFHHIYPIIALCGWFSRGDCPFVALRSTDMTVGEWRFPCGRCLKISTLDGYGTKPKLTLCSWIRRLSYKNTGIFRYNPLSIKAVIPYILIDLLAC